MEYLQAVRCIRFFRHIRWSKFLEGAAPGRGIGAMAGEEGSDALSWDHERSGIYWTLAGFAPAAAAEAGSWRRSRVELMHVALVMRFFVRAELSHCLRDRPSCRLDQSTWTARHRGRKGDSFRGRLIRTTVEWIS